MRAYADASFLGRLLTPEAGTTAAVGLYRNIGRPPLFFLPLHALELANAIRQRAFHQRRSAASAGRAAVKRERDTSLALLAKYISRGAFMEIAVHGTGAQIGMSPVGKHTERLG